MSELPKLEPKKTNNITGPPHLRHAACAAARRMPLVPPKYNKTPRSAQKLLPRPRSPVRSAARAKKPKDMARKGAAAAAGSKKRKELECEEELDWDAMLGEEMEGAVDLDEMGRVMVRNSKIK